MSTTAPQSEEPLCELEVHVRLMMKGVCLFCHEDVTPKWLGEAADPVFDHDCPATRALLRLASQAASFVVQEGATKQARRNLHDKNS